MTSALTAPASAGIANTLLADGILRPRGETDRPVALVAGEAPYGDAAGYATIDAAVAAAKVSSKGYQNPASATVVRDGRFFNFPVLSTPGKVPWDVERGGKALSVHGKLQVHEPGLRAMVDGAKVELLPDYSANTPEAWQDLRLGTYVVRRASTDWGGKVTYGEPKHVSAYAGQRLDYATKKTPYFDPVGDNLQVAVRNAFRMVSRDYGREALMLLKGDNGTYYATAFTGSSELLDGSGRGAHASTPNDLVTMTPTEDAVVGVVSSRRWIDFSTQRAFPGAPVIGLEPRPRPGGDA